MDPKLKSALFRFARGVISGALATGVLAVQALGPAVALKDPEVIALTFAIGCLNGAILASEKWLNWENAQPTTATVA